jgi:hypothetical protein
MRSKDKQEDIIAYQTDVLSILDTRIKDALKVSDPVEKILQLSQIYTNAQAEIRDENDRVDVRMEKPFSLINNFKRISIANTPAIGAIAVGTLLFPLAVVAVIPLGIAGDILAMKRGGDLQKRIKEESHEFMDDLERRTNFMDDLIKETMEQNIDVITERQNEVLRDFKLLLCFNAAVKKQTSNKKRKPKSSPVQEPQEKPPTKRLPAL